MLTHVIRRVVVVPFVLLAVGTVVFVMLRLAPGDPAELATAFSASDEAVAAARVRLGLNKSYIQQYFDFVSGAVRGDFGISYRTTRSVSSDLFSAASKSLILTAAAMTIATVVGMTVGIVSALRANTWIDTVLRVSVLAGVSVPVFWLGLMLIRLFAVELRVLPAFGWGSVRHMILPAFAMSTFSIAIIARMTRSGVLEVQGSDYVRTARAYGLPERRVVLRHVMRNALIPVLTVVGMQTGAVFAGAIITETVFGIQGLGRYTVTAVLARDYPIVQAAVLLGTLAFVLINLIVDLLYAWIDPRVRQ